MLYFQLETFAIHAEKAERTLARMRADLEEYAKRPDAKQSVIDLRNEIIARLVQFHSTASETIDFLMSEYNEAAKYKGLYTSILAEKQGQKAKPLTPNEREIVRYDSLDRLRSEFPHLF